MLPPTDERTATALLNYHAGPDVNADGKSLAAPQITAAEVERELAFDAWDSLVTGNGNGVSVPRMGRSRRPTPGSGASEDNR